MGTEPAIAAAGQMLRFAALRRPTLSCNSLASSTRKADSRPPEASSSELV